MRHRHWRSAGVILVLLLTGALAAISARAAAANPDEPASVGKFTDPKDGWVDLSNHIDKAYGFVPIPIPITEPALGYGLAVGLVFIDKPDQESRAAGFGRPNITAIGGMATENGSRGVAAADIRYWLNERLQTTVAVGYAPLNLEFGGLGNGPLSQHPLGYSLAPTGGLLNTRYRLGEKSRWWAGLGYSYAATEVKFDRPASVPPGIFPSGRTTTTAALRPSVSFDSRDNSFTPTQGFYGELSANLYGKAIGGDTNFQEVDLVLIKYWRLNPHWTLGLRGDFTGTFGEAPFFTRPFISMRGIPAMRYQGEEVAQGEVEVRWQFWERVSWVGFAGTGAAWNGGSSMDNKKSVSAGGTGVRYELARRYGLHVGLDLAFGPGNPVIYVQFGSAWGRP